MEAGQLGTDGVGDAGDPTPCETDAQNSKRRFLRRRHQIDGRLVWCTAWCSVRCTAPWVVGAVPGAVVASHLSYVHSTARFVTSLRQVSCSSMHGGSLSETLDGREAAVSGRRSRFRRVDSRCQATGLWEWFPPLVILCVPNFSRDPGTVRDRDLVPNGEHDLKLGRVAGQGAGSLAIGFVCGDGLVEGFPLVIAGPPLRRQEADEAITRLCISGLNVMLLPGLRYGQESLAHRCLGGI